MQILNRTGRGLIVQTEIDELIYPSDVELNVKLSPPDFFGLDPIGPRLRLAPIGSPVTCTESTLYAGPGRLQSLGSYPPMNFSSTFLGVSFFLNENVATFSFSVNDLEQLNNFVHQIDYMFAPLFSVAMPVSIEVIEISGMLGQKFFYFGGNFPESPPVFITKETLPMEEFFQKVAPQSFVPCAHVISAIRYLQNSERLASEGFHKTTFLSERLLNLSKGLEAIFGSGVDPMKEWLRTYNVAEGYVNVLASVRYLRNESDIGHVAFKDLAAGAVLEVFNFADLASACVRALLASLMRDSASQNFLAERRKDASAPKNKKKNVSLNSEVKKDAVSYLRHYKNYLAPENYDLTVLITK